MIGPGKHSILRRRYGRKVGVIHSCRFIVSRLGKRCGGDHKTRAHEKMVAR